MKMTKLSLLLIFLIGTFYLFISTTLKPRSVNDREARHEIVSIPEPAKAPSNFRGAHQGQSFTKNIIDDDLATQPGSELASVKADESKNSISESSSIEDIQNYILKSLEDGDNIGLTILAQLRGAYLSNGNSDGYQEFLDSLPAQDSEFKIEALSELAQFYAQNTQSDKAIEILSTLIANYPDNDRLNFYLADIWLMQGRINESINQYLASLGINEDPHRYYTLAGIFRDMGQNSIADELTEIAGALQMRSTTEVNE